MTSYSSLFNVKKNVYKCHTKSNVLRYKKVLYISNHVLKLLLTRFTFMLSDKFFGLKQETIV